MKLATRACLVSVLLMAAGSASAIPVNLDFSTLGFAEGQSLEGATLGGTATFTSENSTLTYTNDFGAGIRTSGGSSWDVIINFASAIDSISVRGGDGAGDFDRFSVSLFAFGTNAALGTFSTPLFGGPAEPEWYTLALSGLGLIGRAVIDIGNAGTLPGTGAGQGGVILTDVNFNTAPVSVPEPMSTSLLVLGLAALAAARRGARRSAVTL